MKVAYIAGPYRSRWGIIGIIINILRARRIAIWAWKQGYAVICPHTNSGLYNLFAKILEEVFMEGDLKLLERCNIMFLVPGWEKSEGTRKEVEYAKKQGIEIVEK